MMEGEPYRAQVRKTLFDLIDIAGCSIPHLIHPDMQPEEKIFYYEKAIELYDVIFDGKYAGYFDTNVWVYFLEILKLYHALGETEKVMEYAPDIKVCVGWDGNKDPMSIVDRAIELGAYKVQLFNS